MSHRSSPVKLNTLEEVGLGGDRERIWQLFAPFAGEVMNARSTAWNKEIARRQRRLLKQTAKGWLRGTIGRSPRSEASILREYDPAWRETDYSIYRLPSDRHSIPRADVPWSWGTRHVFASDMGATRVRMLIVARLIERLQPRSVVEIGAGNGINLMLLAGLHPDIRFTGVELTAGGVESVRRFQAANARYPAAMQAFSPLPIRDDTAFRRVEFTRGTAAALSFPDGHFDLAYSVLALEQMEAIRQQALAEMTRVTSRHLIMIEPFAEVNRAFWQRLYVHARGYFRVSVQDLAPFGLEPEFALGDFPQEHFLKALCVLATKPGRRP